MAGFTHACNEDNKLVGITHALDLYNIGILCMQETRHADMHPPTPIDSAYKFIGVGARHHRVACQHLVGGCQQHAVVDDSSNTWVETALACWMLWGPTLTGNSAAYASRADDAFAFGCGMSAAHSCRREAVLVGGDVQQRQGFAHGALSELGLA